jgi:hypothetical protein
MHEEIPLLTKYFFSGNLYAYHAWYSSRTTFLSSGDSIDGLPVSWLNTVREKTYKYLN